MDNLCRVLAMKIGITIVLWFLPLLFCPIRFLHETIGFPDQPDPIFIRLLGTAYGSLLVCYAFGLADAFYGRYPRTAIWTGIASNSAAFLLLVIGAIRGDWSTWKSPARIIMWISLAATGMISAGLIAFGPYGRHSRSAQHVGICNSTSGGSGR